MNTRTHAHTHTHTHTHTHNYPAYLSITREHVVYASHFARILACFQGLQTRVQTTRADVAVSACATRTGPTDAGARIRG